MIIRYKNNEFEADYDVKNNFVGVKNPTSDILKVLNNDRIQRGLLMGLLLNNPFYNLDEAIKNKLL